MTADPIPTPEQPRTDAEMAEYVRNHQCWMADRNVTLADWDRGIRAIEAAASVPAPEQDEAVRAALITSGLMHRLRDYARRAYTDMQDETEADLAAAWAPRVAAALATPPPVPAAPGLDDSEIATIRKALSIGFVSWDGDGWYASPDHLGEDGTSYEDAEATFREAHRILARLSPVQEDGDATK